MNNEPQFEGEEMKMPVTSNKIQMPDSSAKKGSTGFFIFLLFLLGLILVGILYWYQTSFYPVEIILEP